MPKILLTGGGTAGHVTPNIALIPYLKEAGFEIEYMGSYSGIEKQLIEEIGIPYIGIDSGKLRRYLSVQNLKDPAHIRHGFKEAQDYMKNHRPDVVFSKGGYVSVPVIMAAAKENIPVVIHESDLTPGLANKISIPKATRVCYNFPETEKYLPHGKAIHTGLPVRQELFRGKREDGLSLCGFNGEKPVLMVIGGSLGAVKINETIREALPRLLEKFDVAHICGNGKMDSSFNGIEGYRQFEYIGPELPDFFAMADVLVSRAGANVIYEIAALNKPAVLIPLGKDQSRGDQLLNAASFKKRGFSEVLTEDFLSKESLFNDISEVYNNRASYIEAMTLSEQANAAQKVTDIIVEVANH